METAWNNDVLLSMASSFCAGLGLGIFMLVFFITWYLVAIPLVATLALFLGSMALLDRAEVVRRLRWERREWR